MPGLARPINHRALGAPDPALATGTDQELLQQFKQVALMIQRRIDLFSALPFEKIDRLKLEKLTRDIGNA